VASFRHLATKNGLANLTMENLGIKKNNSPHFEKKKAGSRQIYTVCYCRSPELGKIPKKIYLFSGTVAIYC